MSAARQPLVQRPGDAIIVFVCTVFAVTTFVPDITAILGVDLVDFEATRASPPLWPPMFILEPLVEYARACDHIFLHNPPFFTAIIWGDVFVLGPYYVAAVYAFAKQRDWIRVPTFIYASHALSMAPILIVEHLVGEHASPNPALVLALYAPYWILPLVLTWRVRRHRPFAPVEASP